VQFLSIDNKDKNKIVGKIKIQMHDNFSESFSDVTLLDLNDDETALRLAPIIYLSFLMVLGIPGNVLVIIVYHLTVKRRTTHRLFITALAIADLLVCTITVPFEIFQMTHQLTFYSKWGCKLFRALNVLLALVSSFILIALSADRMRRVHQPLRQQLTPRQTLWSVLFVSIGALLFAWPEAVISGLSPEYFEDYNLTGSDCSFSDRYTDKQYTTIYSSILLAIYLGCIITLIIMYSVIGHKVISHAHFRNTFTRRECAGGDNHSNASTNKLKKSDQIKNSASSEDPCDSKSEDDHGHENLSELKSDLKSKSKEDISKDDPKTPYKKNGVMRQANSSQKVTKIAFAISFCFILSYLPFVAVKLNASIAGGIFVSNSTTKVIFPILARTFIINNVVNPIIYGFLDQAFRQKCKMLFNRLTCRV
jgi:hypothetical protein